MTTGVRRIRSLPGAWRLGVLFLTALAVLVAAAGPAAADDATPPQVLAFSMTPSHFNTESADQTITITVTLRDEQTGVGSANSGFYLPGSAQPSRNTPFVRVSGSPFLGTYIGSITLPKGCPGGTWLANLSVSDAVGNMAGFYPADLAAMFGAGSCAVTNDAVWFDAAPPQVTAFSLTPSHVNTESADQTVTLTVTLTDMAGVGMTYAHIAPQKTDRPQIVFTLQRISGDEFNGVYTGTATLPTGSQSGTWCADLWFRDRVENSAVLPPEALEKLFGADRVRVINDAVVADTSPPTIVAYSMTPAEIDSSAGAQTLSVTLTVADDRSGIATVTGLLQPLIGFQRAEFSLQRVSGSDRLAVYQGSVSIPQFAKEGIWRPTLDVEDRMGNLRTMRPDDLAALVPGAEGLSIANTATADQVTIDLDWTLRSGRTSVTFPAGTVVTRQGGGSFAFYRMTAQRFTIDDSMPTADLAGKPIAALMLGIPGLDLSFSKPVSVELAVGASYNGYRMRVQSLVEGGDAWTNEIAVDVAGGSASFTVNHATRFAASAIAPKVRRLASATARRGDRVTVLGRGFGVRRGRVKFGATASAKCYLWSPGKIVCRVPAQARIGRLRVKIVTAAGISNAVTLNVRR